MAINNRTDNLLPDSWKNSFSTKQMQMNYKNIK